MLPYFHLAINTNTSSLPQINDRATTLEQHQSDQMETHESLVLSPPEGARGSKASIAPNWFHSPPIIDIDRTESPPVLIHVDELEDLAVPPFEPILGPLEESSSNDNNDVPSFRMGTPPERYVPSSEFDIPAFPSPMVYSPSSSPSIRSMPASPSPPKQSMETAEQSSRCDDRDDQEHLGVASEGKSKRVRKSTDNGNVKAFRTSIWRGGEILARMEGDWEAEDAEKKQKGHKKKRVSFVNDPNSRDDERRAYCG